MVDVNRAHGQASRIAQLLGEVIIHHAPWTAEIKEQTRRRITDDWLENLEKHTTGIIGNFVDAATSAADIPEPIAKLLQHAKDPSAQYGSMVQQFFVYGVMFSLASTILAPFTQEVQNQIWAAHPDRPLSPADVATALTQAVEFGDAQGVDIPDWAINEAKLSGVNEERFRTMVGIDGVAPDPTDLFEMFRRGVIDEQQFRDGFLEGPTKNKWIPALQKLQYIPATIGDMVRAAVQHQLDYTEAEDLAHKLGLEPAGWVENNPDWFKIMVDISGRPPGPQEAGRMANRGIIPWTGQGPDATTFEQAIAESDVKTKWTDALRKIQEYVPPSGTVTELLLHGAITAEQAEQYFIMDGVPEELAKAYVFTATQQAMEQEKLLARGDITTAYYDFILDRQTATDLLGQLGWRGQSAEWILDIQDMRREISALNSEVRRVGSFYENFKITATGAQSALETLGLPSDQITGLLSIWEVNRIVPNRVPTVRMIGYAVKSGTLTISEGLEKVETLGYSPYDAAIVLSAEAQTQVPLPPEEYPVGQERV